MENEIKLGDVVRCYAYIRKTGNWIKICGEDTFRYQNKKDNLSEPLDSGEGIIVNEIVNAYFEGFVCGKKKIHQRICANWFDGIDTGFGTPPSSIKIEKYDYIDCYEVCLINKNKSWGKRYVPTNKVEKIEGFYYGK